MNIEEALKIAPKECWASEYTEDEHIRAIEEHNDRIKREAVKEFAEWLDSSTNADYYGSNCMETWAKEYLNKGNK